MRHTRITLILFCLFGICYPGLAGDSYFTQLYGMVNRNIETGDYEANLKAVPDFTKEAAFQQLDCYQKGQVFHKIGVSYYMLDQEYEAIRLFRDSVLTIWQNCPEVPDTERATTIYNIGISYQYLGRVEQAKQYLDDALVIFENAPDYPALELAKKYQGVANFYLDIYDSFRAELYYRNALSIFRNIEGTELRRFDILNSFLILSVDFKKHQQAVRYFEQAMDLYRQFPEYIDSYDLSMLYQNAGIAYFGLGELGKSMEMSRAGLELIDPLENPMLYTNAIEKIAVIHGEKGQFSQAVDGLNEVVRIRSEHLSGLESYQALAYAYENLFEVYRKQNDLESAGEFLQKALDALLIQATYDPGGLPVIAQSVAVNDLDLVRMLSLKVELFKQEFAARQDLNKLKRSLSLHMKIDTLINRQLLSMQFQASQLNYLELIQTYYGDAIRDALHLFRLASNKEYLELAYFFSSKTKAIILQNELHNAEVLESIASPDMIDREKALVQHLFDIQEQLAVEPDSKDSLLIAYAEAQRELDLFRQRIEQQAPEYYRNKYTFITPPAIEKIQQNLPQNLAIVEYFYHTDTIFSFWLTQDQLFQVSIPNDDQLDQSMKSFVDQCHDPQTMPAPETGYFLYQRLLDRGLGQMRQQISRLCIIPDGSLHAIPFEALPTIQTEGNSFLLQQYSLTYTYAVGLFLRQQAASFDLPYLGFGTGYSSGLSKKLKNRRRLFGEENLASLSLAREEINRANAIFAGKTFLEEEASLDSFYRYSNRAKIIHLSLHGLVDFEDPLRSSILFDDHQESFILSASDLYSHRVNAELVILSACHSADGKIYLGEGVQGMSKAFMLSGAQSILSSLWNASEASSLAMITSFLKYFEAGIPKDLALHRAKLDYLANARPSQQHPYYWANFILIGELDPGDSFFPAAKIAIIVLLVTCLFLFWRRKRLRL